MAVDNKFPGKDVTPEDLKTKIPLVHNYKPKISTICGVKFGGKKIPVMAGPNMVESEELIVKLQKQLKDVDIIS